MSLRQFLANLDSGTAVALRGEPTASELALLELHMSDSERRGFANAIARITAELADATDAELGQMLDGIDVSEGA